MGYIPISEDELLVEDNLSIINRHFECQCYGCQHANDAGLKKTVDL